MKNEDIKTHDKANSGTASISKEAYEKLTEESINESMKAWELSQRDMVGFLFELPEFLNPQARTESSKQKAVFRNLTDCLREQVRAFEEQDSILCLANEYGMAAEEFGFRNGFAMAMKICMQGMGGGTY